jgi:hypothetical protein
MVLMLSGDDRKTRGKNDLHCRLLVPIPLPTEVLAQEKDIEAIFQHLIAESRGVSEVREEQANALWIGVVLLFFFSAVGFWLLYLMSF